MTECSCQTKLYIGSGTTDLGWKARCRKFPWGCLHPVLQWGSFQKAMVQWHRNGESGQAGTLVMWWVAHAPCTQPLLWYVGWVAAWECVFGQLWQTLQQHLLQLPYASKTWGKARCFVLFSIMPFSSRHLIATTCQSIIISRGENKWWRRDTS